MNLGYPLEVPWLGKRDWGLTIVTGHRDGMQEVTAIAFSEEQAREIARRINAYYGEEAGMPEVSEANAPAEKADPLNAAIEKAAGPVQYVGEAEPAALVPEGAPGYSPAVGIEIGPTPAGMALSAEPSAQAYEAALKAKAAALEAYIQVGIDKVAAAVGQTEIVTVWAFKRAVEALLRHLHQDHPENYL